MAMEISEAQYDLIKTLARQAGFENCDEAAKEFGLRGKRGRAPDVRYDISKSDASALIGALKGGLAPRPEEMGEERVSGLAEARRLIAKFSLTAKELGCE